jgi:hypothetical protein
VPADRPLVRVAVRGAVLGGVVFLVVMPMYIWVEPPWRALVARLAAALVAGVTLVQLRRALADRLADDGTSPLDEARRRRAPGPEVPHHFLGLMSDLRAALRHRRYFEEVWWPRLQALTPRSIARPPLRPGRGPSLASLRRVIDDIERQA